MNNNNKDNQISTAKDIKTSTAYNLLWHWTYAFNQSMLLFPWIHVFLGGPSGKRTPYHGRTNAPFATIWARLEHNPNLILYNCREPLWHCYQHHTFYIPIKDFSSRQKRYKNLVNWYTSPYIGLICYFLWNKLLSFECFDGDDNSVSLPKQALAKITW